MVRRSSNSARSATLGTRSRRKSAGKSVRRAASKSTALRRQAATPSSDRPARRLARADRTTAHAGQSRWSARDDRELKGLIRKNMPARDIGARLGRTASAVRQHVHKLGLSLR